MRNVAALLNARQASPSSMRRHEVSASVASRLPCSLAERELPGVESYDKVFNSLWLSPSLVLATTKCNTLVEWDVVKERSRQIALGPGRAATFDSCGIHALASSPSQTLLACGGTHAADAVVLDLPSYRPMLRLEGHQDWIFGLCFLRNDVLLTCGRDSVVAVWSVRDLPGERDPPTARAPALVRREHRMKVRDIRLLDSEDKLATLSADGTVKLWDPKNMDVINSIRLPEQNELVTMAWDDETRILAVGSHSHVTLLDPRQRGVPVALVSRDSSVRSLSFRHNLLSVGGGAGTVSFFDMRTQAPITVDHARTSIVTGKGWLQRDATYWTHRHHHGREPANAVYTHKWDESGSRLFVGGGPLQVGIYGSYCAMWT